MTTKTAQWQGVKLEEIVEHIDEGIVTIDATGQVTFMNSVAEKILGWHKADLRGKRFIDVVPMLDAEGHTLNEQARPLYRTLHHVGSTMTMATYERKDGRHVPVAVTSTSLVANGKIVGAVGTFRDITEEQKIVQAKSKFVTVASHQLRTPISAIGWWSELLLHGDAGPLNDEQRHHIEAIYESNQRLARMVADMLMESSLDVGTLPINPKKVNLAALSAAIVTEQMLVYKDKRPHIDEAYAPDLPTLWCDPEIIKCILRNLLSNAIKYSPAGKPVAVHISTAAEKAQADSKGSVIITVQDHGYGIPPRVMNNIFTRFFRAPNITHKDTDGTGLGLHIVKQLLDYVGGRITFDSRENEGTVFTVALPLEGMKQRSPQAEVA